MKKPAPKLLIDIGHPAQVHCFKNIYWDLCKEGFEIKVTIKLPAGNLDVSDNIPEYSSYRIFIEDASGRDVAGKTTGDVALDFTDYLVLGDRFQHADTGETIVLTTDDADGSFGSTKHSSYSDDASWSIVATNVEWFDANGNNILDANEEQITLKATPFSLKNNKAMASGFSFDIGYPIWNMG